MLRKEIDDCYKWDLSPIVDGNEAWEELYKKLETEYSILGDFKGKLDQADNIYECLTADDKISLTVERLYVYARMRRDEDASVTLYQGMVNRIELLSVKISSLTSYIMPELSALDDSFLESLILDERFAPYDYAIKKIIRSKAHTLSEKEEKILSELGSFSDGFHDAFSMFDNVDIKFAPVKDSDGNLIEMSHGIYSKLMQSSDREVREQAFESMFASYKDMNNTLAQIYGGNVKKNAFYAKVRNFNSALERATFSENVPTAVYEKLLENVKNALPTMHEYIGLRKKALGLDELHCYDLHVPIVEGASLSLPYAEAYQLVKKALAPLGEDYQQLLEKAYNEKWIDVYENKGKTSGAYSWGSYNAHPYVLLNYQPVTHDVFTIAHELGHAMHSYYSNSTQPYAKAGYEIFVAEVASTVNEVLLLKYLIKDSDANTRKYLLSYYLDMFRTTLFRQTQFAAFEERAHAMAEADEPLTAEALNDVYYSLNKEFYGDELVHDDLIKYEWSRIPHFYRSFYVYKYATGITSAVSIARTIIENGDSAVKKYKEFLSTGGSMPPVEELKIAGVDLTEDKPFKDCMTEFKTTLDALKELII